LQTFGTGLLKIGLDSCAIHVLLETIKQHLRILMLKQYRTGNILKKLMQNPGSSWTLLSAEGRALPQDWGEGGGVVPISDLIRLAGMSASTQISDKRTCSKCSHLKIFCEKQSV